MKPACRLCPYTGLQPGEVLRTVKISSTGEELRVKKRPQYVGETGCTAEERFVGHRNSIVQAYHQGTSLPVGQHFQQAGHSVSDFVFTPVERIYSDNVFVRKARERHLINTLDLIDNGLNKKL